MYDTIKLELNCLKDLFSGNFGQKTSSDARSDLIRTDDMIVGGDVIFFSGHADQGSYLALLSS
jgi:hypothetical protein